MKNTRLPRNALAAIIQVFFSAIFLFILYRILVQKIGVDGVGLWSLVLAGTSVSRLAELGLSVGVVKFVSSALARNDVDTAVSIICLSALLVAVILLLGMLLLYPIFLTLIDLALAAPGARQFARELLPIAVASFWIIGVSAVFLSGIDGCQRIDLRSAIIILGSATYLGGAFILTDAWGLRGVAWAHLGQSLFVAICAVLTLARLLPLRKVRPAHWSWSQVKMLFTYGANIQFIMIAQFFIDPVTKAILTRFGDLSVTGYYEMANRMISQFRTVIASSFQASVPVISTINELDPGSISLFYRQLYSLISFIVPPYYALLAVSVPAIGIIWLGNVDERFLYIAWAACLGWAVNTMAIPAYLAYMGIGRLRWNTLTQGTIGLLNVIFSLILGLIIGWRGVVAGSMTALAVGSTVVIFAFHHEYRISFNEIFPKQNRLIFLCSMLGVSFMVIAVSQWFPPKRLTTALIPVVLVGSMLGILLLVHPTTRAIKDLVYRGIKGNR